MAGKGEGVLWEEWTVNPQIQWRTLSAPSAHKGHRRRRCLGTAVAGRWRGQEANPFLGRPGRISPTAGPQGRRPTASPSPLPRPSRMASAFMHGHLVPGRGGSRLRGGGHYPLLGTKVGSTHSFGPGSRQKALLYTLH